MAGSALQNCSSSNTCCALLCFTKIKKWKRIYAHLSPLVPSSLPIDLLTWEWVIRPHGAILEPLKRCRALIRAPWHGCSCCCCHISPHMFREGPTQSLHCTGLVAARDTINTRKPCQSQLLAFFFIFSSIFILFTICNGKSQNRLLEGSKCTILS